MEQAFRMFDRNGDGYISPWELKEVLKKENQYVTDEEVKEVIQEIDDDKDGKINFTEFARAMSITIDQSWGK